MPNDKNGHPINVGDVVSIGGAVALVVGVYLTPTGNNIEIQFPGHVRKTVNGQCLEVLVAA